MGLGMMLISGAVASLVLCLNKPFVILWVGSKIFGGNSLTLFFIANTIVRQLDLCFVVALFAFGYEKQLALKSLADGVLSTALAFALSRLFGAYGVVGSYLLTAALFAFPASLYLLSRECGVSPVAMVKPFFPWCWRFALLAALFWKVSALGWINSYPKAAFAALGILLVYTLVMSTCLKKSELWPYIEHLIARIQRIVPGFGRLAPGTV
jgi:O-antigen/teichoic acid export membrane protein